METDLFHSVKESRKSVLKLFDRTENEVNEDVKNVKDWIKTQPHLPEIMEDARIENFLIENKFSIEKTKQKIDLYYTVRTLLSDFYENFNPKSQIMQQYMQISYCCLHPKLTEDYYRPYFFVTKQPNQLNPRLLVLQAVNISEIVEECTVGELLIFDMRNITLSDLKKVTPMLVSKIFAVYKVYALRMKALHFIYSPSYVSLIVTILKAVLKPKLFARVHVHEDAEILKEIFKKEDLPRDYGGDGPSLDELKKILQEKLNHYQHRFDQLETMRVNESLRPLPLDNDEILGYYGSFKKLNLD